MDAGASEHAVALLVASHRRSWFTVDGIERLSSFMMGTMAGTSLSDIVFVVSLARVTSVIEDRLAADGLVDFLDPEPAINYFGYDGDEAPLKAKILSPTWIDDYAVPVVA